MTLAEQREKLAEKMAKAVRRRTEHRTRAALDESELHWHELDNMRAAIAAISAAGLAIVGPEVTEEMLHAGVSIWGDPNVKRVFKAMVAAGDLGR